MKRILHVSIIIVVIVFMISVSIACWQIGRVINYELSYKDMVVETVKEIVKNECLKK